MPKKIRFQPTYVPISEVKENPDNPRIMMDDKFKKLCKSIRELPDMLEMRPIVVNDDMIVLGGNMRLKACTHVGLKEVPIIKASSLSPEQQREFIIKDNVGFGEWDWDLLANEWDTEMLTDWGLDLVGIELDADDFGEDFALPDGEKGNLEQITFTTSSEQMEIIKQAVEDVKKTEEFNYVETFGNENGNGNAIYLIVTQWMQNKEYQ